MQRLSCNSILMSGIYDEKLLEITYGAKNLLDGGIYSNSFLKSKYN